MLEEKVTHIENCVVNAIKQEDFQEKTLLQIAILVLLILSILAGILVVCAFGCQRLHAGGDRPRVAHSMQVKRATLERATTSFVQRPHERQAHHATPRKPIEL